MRQMQKIKAALLVTASGLGLVLLQPTQILSTTPTRQPASRLPTVWVDSCASSPDGQPLSYTPFLNHSPFPSDYSPFIALKPSTRPLVSTSPTPVSDLANTSQVAGIVTDSSLVEDQPSPTVSPVPTATATPENTPVASAVPSQTPTPIPTVTPTPTPNNLPADGLPTSSPTTSPEVQTRTYTAPADLEPHFQTYASAFNVDPNLLKHLASCESHFNPGAVNGPYGGMFQYAASTWSSTRNTMGLDPNPDLRFDAEESIKTTAFKISIGGLGAWANCANTFSQ